MKRSPETASAPRRGLVNQEPSDTVNRMVHPRLLVIPSAARAASLTQPSSPAQDLTPSSLPTA